MRAVMIQLRALGYRRLARAARAKWRLVQRYPGELRRRDLETQEDAQHGIRMLVPPEAERL